MYGIIHKLVVSLVMNQFISASVKGQPPYKGQKAHSQCVRYSEVPLYLAMCSDTAICSMTASIILPIWHDPRNHAHKSCNIKLSQY